MSPRMQEIVDLLRQGTSNDAVRWKPFKTTDAMSASLNGAIFVIEPEAEETDEPAYAWELRVLNTRGDEVDSVQGMHASRVGNATADQDADADRLATLWADIQSQRERLLDAELRPIAESLRASVLGTA